MEWYYAVGGEQKGPVNEQEFQRLAQQGVVTPQTLVWREGLPDWQPYGGSTPPPVPGNVTGGGVVCAGCKGIFPGTEVVSLSGGLYCAACKPLALQRLREGESGTTAAEAMRKEHLKHEASVKSIGFLYYVGGAALLVGAVVMMVGIGAGGSGRETILVALMAGLFLVLGAGQLWVGAGLRRLRRWARIPTGILSGIGLIVGFPIGTIINAYVLYLVFSEKGKTVFSDEYRAVIEQTPHIRYRTSIIIWILLGLVVALIGFGLIAAFVAGRR